MKLMNGSLLDVLKKAIEKIPYLSVLTLLRIIGNASTCKLY